ncbi:MAG: DUF2200 family protein [Flavobacteriales bacterium]|nr:DUF2200 family protein [Flavobacteriales bacterium]
MSQTYSVRQRFSIALKHEICDLVSSGEMSMTEAKSTFKDFFEQANLNSNASLIKGVICGYRLE